MSTLFNLRSRIQPVWFAAALLLLPLGSQAARPLMTDDAGVLARGECELVLASEQQREAGQRARAHSLETACGLGWRSQLGLGLTRSRSGGVSETGWGLAGKTSLWAAPGDTGRALAMSWQLDAARPGSGGWQHVGTALNLLATWPVLGRHSLHANLGHLRDEMSHQRSTTWGLAIEHAGLGYGLAPMAELFGDDRAPAWWNLGLRWTTASGRASLDLSYGRQVSSARPALLTLGAKLSY